MIKVRCRSYEGLLLRLETVMLSGVSLAGDVRCTYEIELQIDAKAKVELRCVSAKEIEFLA